MARNRKKNSKSKEYQENETSGTALESAPAKPQAQKTRTKTAEERRRIQIDGIKKTVYPSVLGVAAGFVCFYSPTAINQLPWHFVMLIVIGATYFIQKLTYPFLGIDAAEFNGKDWFYVEFMAIDLWLVSWTLLLN
jgi:hypothetical protein